MKRFPFTVLLTVLFALSLSLLAGCGDDKPAPGGTPGTKAKMPEKIILGFVPSLESDKIAENAKPMAEYLSKELGVPVETFVSTDYTGLIEAMGSGKVDIGTLTPFSYVLAHDQNGAEVILKTSRHGKLTYKGVFYVRTDSPIKSIEDMKGKKIAFTDAASTSGYLYPTALIKSKGYDPETFFSKTEFAGSHDNAVMEVYNGQVDVAAAYDTVRDKMKQTLPDIEAKTRIIGETAEIPNDTFSVRKDMDPELREKIKQILLKYGASEEGKKTLLDIYDIDGIAEAKDSDYDSVRDVAKNMGVPLEDVIKPKAKTPAPKMEGDKMGKDKMGDKMDAGKDKMAPGAKTGN